MTEKYKVRGAMLALREFTVEDLARHSGVNPRTIHTELIRAGDLVEKLPPAAGPRPRGGQPLRYRVRESRLEALRRELEGAFTALSQVIVPAGSTSTETPLALQVAEDTLERLAAAPLAERPHLLETAGLQLQVAERQIAALAASPAHQASVVPLQQRIVKARQFLSPAASRSRIPAGVVLVDAADGRLSHQITKVVNLSDVVSMVIQSARLRQKIEQEVQNLAHDFVIVALDSDHSERHRRRVLADAIIKTAAEPGRSMFIDAGFDENLRNYVLEHECFYVGGAASLKQAALRGLFRAWQFGHVAFTPTLFAGDRPQQLTGQAVRR